MIKKSYLSILSVIISISIFSQEFEKPKEVDEDFFKEYKKHSVSFNICGKDGFRHSIISATKLTLDCLVNIKMNENKQLKIVVSCHADNVGTKDYNVGLSRRCAEIYVKFLADKGIDTQRLIAEFYGYDMEKYNSVYNESDLANR